MEKLKLDIVLVKKERRKPRFNTRSFTVISIMMKTIHVVT